jgi:hypothetical protein
MAPTQREIDDETIGWWFRVDAAMRRPGAVIAPDDASRAPSAAASRYITLDRGRRVAPAVADRSTTVSPEVAW